jgi:hypothetical protein
MEQLDGLRRGGDAEFVMKGGDTELVLTAHALLLVLVGVTAHEQPMRRLATRIGVYCLLGELNCEHDLSEIAVGCREELEYL